MENNIIKPEDLTSSEIAKFNITDSFLAELKEKFLPLKINGVDDQSGYDQVKDAKKLVQSKRTEVEKKRKELKDDYLRTGQAIDKEAKRITSEIVEVESHLDREIKTIDDEKARIKLEKENIERLPIRKKMLEEIGASLPDLEILAMDVMPWSIYVMNLKEKTMIEKEAKLKAGQELIDSQRRQIERDEELRKAKEQAVIDAQNKFRLDQEAKAKQESAEKLKAEKKAARAPDKDKLKELATRIKYLEKPEVKSEEAKAILKNVDDLLSKVIIYINKNIENL